MYTSFVFSRMDLCTPLPCRSISPSPRYVARPALVRLQGAAVPPPRCPCARAPPPHRHAALAPGRRRSTDARASLGGCRAAVVRAQIVVTPPCCPCARAPPQHWRSAVARALPRGHRQDADVNSSMQNRMLHRSSHANVM